MLSPRHAIEGRHRLALAAGGDDGQLLGLVAANIGDVNQHAGGNLHIAQLDSSTHNVEHAAAGDGHLAAVVRRGVDDLLDAVHSSP